MGLHAQCRVCLRFSALSFALPPIHTLSRRNTLILASHSPRRACPYCTSSASQSNALVYDQLRTSVSHICSKKCLLAPARASASEPKDGALAVTPDVCRHGNLISIVKAERGFDDALLGSDRGGAHSCGSSVDTCTVDNMYCELKLDMARTSSWKKLDQCP